MSGSARNQVRWRLANATFRAGVVRRSPPRGRRARRGRRRPRGSRWRRRRAGRPGVALRAGPPPPRAGRPRTGPRARAPIHRGVDPRVDAQAQPDRPARDSRAAPAAARRPGARRSRGPGRRDAGCAGRCAAATAGASATSRRRAPRSPSAVELALELAPGGRGRSAAASSGEAAGRRRAGRARCRRRGSRRRRARRCRRAPSVGVAREVGDAERLVRVDEVEAVMRDPARSAALTLAVPMSRPR